MVFGVSFWPGQLLERNIWHTQHLYNPITHPETIFVKLDFFDPLAVIFENFLFFGFQKFVCDGIRPKSGQYLKVFTFGHQKCNLERLSFPKHLKFWKSHDWRARYTKFGKRVWILFGRARMPFSGCLDWWFCLQMWILCQTLLRAQIQLREVFRCVGKALDRVFCLLAHRLHTFCDGGIFNP